MIVVSEHSEQFLVVQNHFLLNLDSKSVSVGLVGKETEVDLGFLQKSALLPSKSRCGGSVVAVYGFQHDLLHPGLYYRLREQL